MHIAIDGSINIPIMQPHNDAIHEAQQVIQRKVKHSD